MLGLEATVSAAARIHNLLFHILPPGPYVAPDEPDEPEIDEPDDAEADCIRLVAEGRGNKAITIRPRGETTRRLRECATTLDVTLGAALALAVHKMWMDLRAQEANTSLE